MDIDLFHEVAFPEMVVVLILLKMYGIPSLKRLPWY